MTELDPKPYHRQSGEPSLWFHRFQHFMDLGPGRTIAHCYQEIMNQERRKAGRPLLSTSASCPKVWRQRAIQFDWADRADAWDQEKKYLDRIKIESVRTTARDLTPMALRVLESTMLGKLKNPDGTLAPGQNCAQRRLAAEKILELVGVAVIESQEEDDEYPEIKAIRIIDPFSPEGIEHAEATRRQASAQYAERMRRYERQEHTTPHSLDSGLPGKPSSEKK